MRRTLKTLWKGTQTLGSRLASWAVSLAIAISLAGGAWAGAGASCCETRRPALARATSGAARHASSTHDRISAEDARSKNRPEKKYKKRTKHGTATRDAGVKATVRIQSPAAKDTSSTGTTKKLPEAE